MCVDKNNIDDLLRSIVIRFSSRVTRACPVTTDLIMRVNVRTTGLVCSLDRRNVAIAIGLPDGVEWRVNLAAIGVKVVGSIQVSL